jgi:hypothetical protein
MKNKKKDNKYFVDSEIYLCMWKTISSGFVSMRIANFDAWITDEVIEDNGFELTCNYVIEGKTKNQSLPKIEVPASSFASLNWLCHWGSLAIVEPGHAIKEYVRHAIQSRSTKVKRLTQYTHTGWREIDGKWVYLSSRGGIGTNNVSVKLPQELQRYNLPLEPKNEIEAIKTSLSLLDIGKRKITLPLFSLSYLAPLTTILDPMPNFSGYINGDTGTFKTTLAILFLSHFGNFNSVSNLSNFDDTSNALEKRAFLLKDTLLIVDDFHPSIKKADAQLKESIAQRLIRSCSNRTGRDRLNADTSEKGRYEPRGMLLITGEELVSLQSTIARVIVIEVSKGDVDEDKLTNLQGKSHLLPHAMTSYILWLRDNLDEIRKTFPAKFNELRGNALSGAAHKKMPEQVAFLQFALETALSWIVHKGVLTEVQADSISKEGWYIFLDLAKKQADRIEREDPIKRFQEILETLLAQGKAKIEYKDITDPQQIIGGPRGDLIGYYDDLNLYLLPPALWNSLQRYCIAEGSHFPFSKQTFYRMLANKKVIEARDGRNVIPEWIRGKTQRVLKFIDNDMCSIIQIK